MMIRPRISLLALSLLALTPAGHAGAIDETTSERAFSSASELFYGGPQWFRDALSNPASRLRPTSFVYDRSGDRVIEASYVGTLRDGYSADVAGFFSPLFRATSAGISAPLIPNAPTATNAIITWDGAGSASEWLTATNWSTDTVPGSGDTATFATTDGSTSIGINFTDPTNNGPANQIVGAIALTGGESKSISSSSGAGTLTINGVAGVLLSNGSAFDLTLQNGAGAMTVALPNSGSIDVTSTGSIIISSPVTGAAAITKTGSGTLILSGSNNYTGGTTVAGGTLLVNNTVGSGTGSGVINVNNSGTLGGTGTILAGSNNVTIDSGGIITGGANGSVGTLTLTTNALVISGTYLNDISGLTADRITLSGNLILTGATLDFNTLATPTAPIYPIVTYTGTLSGTFSLVDVPQGYQVQYNTGSIDLVAVPEPSTWIGAGLAFATVAFTQRRKLRGLLAGRA